MLLLLFLFCWSCCYCCCCCCLFVCFGWVSCFFFYLNLHPLLKATDPVANYNDGTQMAVSSSYLLKKKPSAVYRSYEITTRLVHDSGHLSHGCSLSLIAIFNQRGFGLYTNYSLVLDTNQNTVFAATSAITGAARGGLGPLNRKCSHSSAQHPYRHC